MSAIFILALAAIVGCVWWRQRALRRGSYRVANRYHQSQRWPGDLGR